MTIENTAPLTAPGWYQHPGNSAPGVEMYWDGNTWRTDMVKHPKVPDAYAPMPVAVGNHAPVQQVVVHTGKKKVNHVLHFCLTVLTAGLWLPVWIIVAIAA